MKIPPTIARASLQGLLLKVAPQYNCIDNATARNAYGSAAQEIAWAALGLIPIAINGNYEVCFDAEHEGKFFEIKSVRAGHKVVVYDWRMKKEQAANVSLEYVIVIHRLKKCRDNITDSMLKAGVMIARLPFEYVYRIASSCPLRQMNTNTAFANKRNGYRRAGYRDGYRNIPIALLLAGTKAEVVNFEFYGVRYNTTLLTL